MRRAVLGACGMAMVMVGTFVACSSNTTVNQSTCGPGTTLVDGTCVVADSGSGTDGIVAPDGSDARDAADATSPPDGTSPPDTIVETSTGDDPCPAKLNVNCSTTCASPGTMCSDVSCGAATELRINSASMLPFVMRTPHAKTDPACKASGAVLCGTYPVPLYGMQVLVDLWRPNGIRIRVGAPWRIIINPVDKYCMKSGPGREATGCYYLPSSIYYFTLLIASDDPSAPARNVTIEESPVSGDAGTPCP